MSVRLVFGLWLSLIACCGLATSTARAQDLWTSDAHLNTHKRTFALFEVSEGVWQLKLFTQERGEYQLFVKAQSFTTKAQAEKFLKHAYPDLVQVPELKPWPVEREQVGKKAGSGLWVVTQSWSEEWEERYSDWIQAEVKADFFNRYGIATDCADVLVGLRWIFARNHGLPAVNTLSATGNLFSQDTILRQWRGLRRHETWHRDELFKAALNYIMNLTSTRTLIRDAYPVQLSEKGLRAGSFILTVGPESNHVKVIAETHFNDPADIPLYTLASTTPRSRKDMVREVFLDEEWPKLGVKDLLALRWPKRTAKGWTLTSAQEHANYGLEQYSEELRSQNPSFIQFLLSRLKPDFSPRKIVAVAMNDIKGYLEMRRSIVEDGYRFCQNRDCSVGTGAWDDWSTPSRDSKIAAKFENYEMMLARYESFYPGLISSWKIALKDVSIELFGTQVSLSAIHYIWREKLFNSDPSVPPRQRWGLEYEDFFRSVLSDLEALLQERDDIFERSPNECGANISCYPKNSIWLSLNTYHIDEKLLALSSKVDRYCYVLQTSECTVIRDQLLAQELVTYSGEASAAEWLRRIPHFHADPRSPMAQRWGLVTAGQRNLGAFEDLRIASNGRALIDNLVVIDLITGKAIARGQSEEHLYLSRGGDLLKNDKTSGKILWLAPEEENWTEFTIENLPEDYDWNLAQLIDYESGSLLILPFVAQGDELIIVNFKRESSPSVFRLSNKNYAISGRYLLAPLSQKQFWLVDLATDRQQAISLLEPKIKDPLLLTIWGESRGLLLAQYSDQNEDIYRQVVVDPINETARFLATPFAQTKIRHWDNRSARGLLENQFNSEYPEIFDFSFDQTGMKRGQLLGNLLEDISAPYVLIAKGGRWDQTFTRTLYRLGPAGVQTSAQDSPDQSLSALAQGFLLRKTGDKAHFYHLEDQRRVGLDISGDLTLATALNSKEILMLTASEKIILARFKTMLGDYFDYGEIYQVNENGELEIIATNSFAKRWEEGVLKEWASRFSRFRVYLGTVVATGVGTAVWYP